MKHTKEQSNRAKKNLKAYGDYMDSDFYLEKGIWYLNCKDNVGISAFDLQRTIIAEIREKQDEEYYDNLAQEARNFGGL